MSRAALPQHPCCNPRVQITNPGISYTTTPLLQKEMGSQYPFKIPINNLHTDSSRASKFVVSCCAAALQVLHGRCEISFSFVGSPDQSSPKRATSRAATQDGAAQSRRMPVCSLNARTDMTCAAVPIQGPPINTRMDKCLSVDPEGLGALEQRAFQLKRRRVDGPYCPACCMAVQVSWASPMEL